MLVLAGEGIFVLPFILVRVFYPTYLELFQINNEQLGYCQSIYGIVALLCYLLGGSLADKFHPRKLMAISLWLTAASGIYLATYPSYQMLQVLHGFWGFSTIFLFWSAMIKTTRIWGGETNQGKGFGFLDGGRGLVGAGFGFLGIVILTVLAPQEFEYLSFEEKQVIFRRVILISSGFVALIGLGVYFGMKFKDDYHPKEKNPLSYYIECLKIPTVWLLMIIVLCAYVGYKITDIFPLYAQQIMGESEENAALLGSNMLLIRAATAIFIGFTADKFGGTKLLILSFVVIILGATIMVSGVLATGTFIMFVLSIIFMSVGIFATRVLYYSVMHEGKIPIVYTGTAVGIVSIVGYAPDIFVGPIRGALLDRNPGELGFQYVFALLGGFALVGLLFSILYYRQCKINNPKTAT